MELNPIRESRNEWRIPVFCYHKCSDAHCAFNIEFDPQIGLQAFKNPDYINGKCSRYKSLTPTSIQLCMYNMTTLTGSMGELYNPDMVVITDSDFGIQISYPLSQPIIIKIKTSLPTTLRQLLQIIHDVYVNIYKIEEETATPTRFEIPVICGNCRLSSVIGSLERPTDIPKELMDDVCSICHSEFDSQANRCSSPAMNEGTISKGKCNHIFHTRCISEWITRGPSRSCPICRTSLFDCRDCDNSGVKIAFYDYVVLPLELRIEYYRRNSTDGVYGIYDVDFENLYLREIVYSRTRRMVHLIM